MIHGVRIIDLEPNLDHRGSLTEVFQKEWSPLAFPELVLVMHSHAGVMRGSHVHRTHTDYFVPISGRGLLGMKDVRERSPTFGETALVELDAAKQKALIVGPGIIHGFYSQVASILLSVESAYYDPNDEVKVNWADPNLGIDWPGNTALTSYDEGEALSLEELMQRISPWQKEYKI